MEDIQQIASVPIITALVYGAMVLFKYTFYNKESLIRLIPVFCVLLGCVLGILVFYTTPELILASNVFTAILVGGASGLAATGTHQMFKQLYNKENCQDAELDSQIEKSPKEDTQKIENSTSEDDSQD